MVSNAQAAALMIRIGMLATRAGLVDPTTLDHPLAERLAVVLKIGTWARTDQEGLVAPKLQVPKAPTRPSVAAVAARGAPHGLRLAEPIAVEDNAPPAPDGEPAPPEGPQPGERFIERDDVPGPGRARSPAGPPRRPAGRAR